MQAQVNPLLRMMTGKKQTAAATSPFKDVKTTFSSHVPKVRCSFCGTVVTKNSYRMKKHIENCLKCTGNVKIKYSSKKYPIARVSASNADDSEDNTERIQPKIEVEGVGGAQIPSSGSFRPRGVSLLPRKPRDALRNRAAVFLSSTHSIPPTTGRLPSQSLTVTCADRMTEAVNTKISTYLAKAIYATGAPLDLVDNRYWMKFFSSLRPSFNPPSHTNVSNTLLEQVFEETSASVRETVATATSVALLSEGWKNTKNEAVINFHVTVPNPVFWSSLETSSTNHTAEYVADQFQKVVEEVGSQKVFGLCTDYALNMKTAWALVRQKYPHVQPYGCLVHSLNLIFTDICQVKSLFELVASCEAVAKSVNSSLELQDLFKQNQQQFIKKQQQAEEFDTNKRSQPILKLPVNTWWGSSVQCMESVLANKQPLQALSSSAACKDLLNITIKKNLQSEIFWAKISLYLSLLKPVVDIIKLAAEGNQYLSFVMKVFYDIENNFEQKIQQNLILQSDDKNQIKSIISNGKNFAVTRIHKSANLLDPNYRGCHLTEQEITEAFDLIQEVTCGMPDVEEGQVFGELADYRSRQKIFQKSFLWEAVKRVSPYAWWAGLLTSLQLSRVARKILDLPPTCTCGKIPGANSSRRKRLTSSKADKLLFVARNLCLTENECELEEERNLLGHETSIRSQPSSTSVAPQASTSGTWFPWVNPEAQEDLKDIADPKTESDDQSEDDL